MKKITLDLTDLEIETFEVKGADIVAKATHVDGYGTSEYATDCTAYYLCFGSRVYTDCTCPSICI